MEQFAGIILAGGYSRRMGRDKTRIPIAEKSMLERALMCMESVSTEIDTIYVSCREDAPLQTTYPLLYDSFTGIGPIAGIYTALQHTQKACLFMPVDTPIMKADYLALLIASYREHEARGIDMISFQSHEGIVESLISIFSPRALPSIQQSIQHGIYKVTATIPQEKQYYLTYPTEEYCFYNVNTPNDIHVITAYVEHTSPTMLSNI